jgi:acyl-CoA synthetase (AMP-forming)/AMP-acid ligase II
MHPLGSQSDHLNTVRDAEVELLIFEGGRYDARAAELAGHVPGVKLAALGQTELADDLCSLAASMQPRPLRPPMLDLAGIEAIGYSGGTTGKPKSMAARRRTSAALMSIMLADWEWPEPPRVLSCAPLSHAGGTMFLPTLLKNGTMLVHPRFDPLAVLQAIQDYKINCMMLVPTMIYALLDHPRFEEFDLSSLETIFYGASLMSPVRLKEAIERIGPVFFQFYGQAEAPMTVTVFRKSEHDANNLERLSSCGRPVPWLLVELLDSENRPVPHGQPGEICVQGPIVMDGYRDNPELNAEVFSGGWLHTGDVAIRDHDGFLRIVDRKKDMIVSGGFNIYPRDIEDALALPPRRRPVRGHRSAASAMGRGGQGAGGAQTRAVRVGRRTHHPGSRAKGPLPGAQGRGVHSRDPHHPRGQGGQEGPASTLRIPVAGAASGPGTSANPSGLAGAGAVQCNPSTEEEKHVTKMALVEKIPDDVLEPALQTNLGRALYNNPPLCLWRGCVTRNEASARTGDYHIVLP